jgi:hypothetical protein
VDPTRSPPMGRLADGTSFFGRLGQVAHDLVDDTVQCHLFGRWLKVVGGTHIRWHGWTLDRYREAFQLRESVPTCSASVSGRLRRSAKARIGQNGFAVAPAATDRSIKSTPAWRSFATVAPWLVAELDPHQNKNVDPHQLAAAPSASCGGCVVAAATRGKPPSTTGSREAPNARHVPLSGGLTDKAGWRRSDRSPCAGPIWRANSITPATGTWRVTRSPSPRPERCGGAAPSAPTSGKRRPPTALADTLDAPPVGPDVGDRAHAQFPTSARLPPDTPNSPQSSIDKATRTLIPVCSERNQTRSSGGAADPAATDG